MFKETNNLNSVKVEKKEKTEGSVEEIEQELSDLCARHGNPVVFHRHGSEMLATAPPLRNFEGETGDEEYKGILIMLEERFIEYLHSPIFTDSFHRNHPARRSWQDKAEKELSATGLYECYETNCLNTTRWMAVDMLEQACNDPGFKFHPELVANLNKIFVANAQYIPSKEEYNYEFTDEQKIDCIPKIEVVMKKVLAEITVELKD